MNALRFTHRLATEADVRAIEDLMKASIAENMKEFLTGEEISATQESMGLDTTLISDRTYFVVETVQDGKPVIVGCGGWSRRRTLYGGDHTAGRDDSYADPGDRRGPHSRDVHPSRLDAPGHRLAAAATGGECRAGCRVHDDRTRRDPFRRTALPGAGLRRGRPRDADGRQRLAQRRHRDAQNHSHPPGAVDQDGEPRRSMTFRASSSASAAAGAARWPATR